MHDPAPDVSMALPVIAPSAPAERRLAAAAIALSFLLLAALGVRIVTQLQLAPWWIPFALVTGMAAADFLSGVVHWAADTWGRDDLPVIGRRLLVPFRVHHINPDDFLQRRFVDVNGDVAILAVPALIALLMVRVDTAIGAAAFVFGFAFCGAGMLTNQIHQWAHMPKPPRAAVALQACGFFLSRAAHAAHHRAPHEVHYCITTGWCNRPLEALRFFRMLERVVTRVTGAQARGDDCRYGERYVLSARRAR